MYIGYNIEKYARQTAIENQIENNQGETHTFTHTHTYIYISQHT